MYKNRISLSLPSRFAALAALVCIAPLAALLPALVFADDFLPPEQAFRVSADADGEAAVSIGWDIAPGYYLYRSKLGFASETDGIELGQPALPPAQTREDKFFGEVEIYRDRVDVPVPLTRQADADNRLAIEVRYQGCADAGFCYPPERKTVQVDLPRLTSTDDSASVGDDTAATDDLSASPLTALTRPQTLGFGLEDDILAVEDAFRFSADVAGPDQLRLSWTIAPGTYLYQEKIDLSLENSNGVQIGDFQLPEAEIKPDTVRPDGSIGEVAIYHGLVELDAPLLRAAAEPTEITLVAKFQGCAERGICYPPVTERVALALPAATSVVELPSDNTTVTAGGLQDRAGSVDAARESTAAPPERVSEQDQIAARLAETGILGAMGIFFVLGLLLAFTPCVFPMIPILSGIIAGQGKDITARRAFVLSLVYVLAMALTYAVVGVVAGLFGANLQAAFQNPWVLTAFAAIFVALALSMFGFYELQLPSSLQTKLTEISNKQQGGTLVGVAIMGALSALIVGPCVAPPLMGALIFIGQTGDGLLGFFALLGLGLGMGAPLLAIGTSAGKLLPRAGAWMDAVKAVFGVLLLAVAILLLERILPAAVTMLLYGLLLIASGVYMGALAPLGPDGGGWRKLWKSIGLALLVYGVLMLVGAAAGGRDTLQPLRGIAPTGGAAAEAHAQFKRIKTVADLDRELAAASAAGRPVMLDFYADWCVSCKEMERYTFPEPEVQAEMAKFVLLQADVTANDADDKALMQERFGLPGPPAMLFFDANGEERRGWRLVGFVPADEFAAHLREVPR
jgi:thiol:disulfide interchange protein DsbD